MMPPASSTALTESASMYSHEGGMSLTRENNDSSS